MAADDTMHLELRVPIGAHNRTWHMLTLRRAAAPVDGIDDHRVIARCAGVPLAAIYDLSPPDLADAIAWPRG